MQKISLGFISQCYFSVLKDARLNLTHYLVMKINKIYRECIMKINKIYRECTKKPYSFLTIDTMLPVSDLLRFKKNLFHSYKNDSS